MIIRQLIDRIDMRIALRNGVGASVAWVVGGEFSELFPHPNPLISSLWTVLTALLVLQAHLGATYKAAWVRFLGLAIGTSIGAILATYFGADTLTLGLSIAGTVIVCSLFKLQEAVRIAVATVAVIIILLPINPNLSPWEFSLYRFLDSCLGILTAVFVAHVVFPVHAYDALRKNMGQAMQKMGQLYEIATHPETCSENQKANTAKLIKDVDSLLFEGRKTLEDSKPELITQSAKINDWTLFLAQMDDLFEQVLALKHVYRSDTQKLFDDELNHHLEEVVGKISLSFKEIGVFLEKDQSFSSLPDLGLSLNYLNDELIHFREGKKTHAFNLEEVEHFFVFFYNLKSIMKLLKKIESYTSELI